MATITVSESTRAHLQKVAALHNMNADDYADILLTDALHAVEREFHDACRGIAAGIADMEAGRTISLEDFVARRRAVRAAHYESLLDAEIQDFDATCRAIETGLAEIEAGQHMALEDSLEHSRIARAARLARRQIDRAATVLPAPVVSGEG